MNTAIKAEMERDLNNSQKFIDEAVEMIRTNDNNESTARGAMIRLTTAKSNINWRIGMNSTTYGKSELGYPTELIPTAEKAVESIQNAMIVMDAENYIATEAFETAIENATAEIENLRNELQM